jgi:hypothetical protein
LDISAHVQSELHQDVEGKIYVEFYHRSCNRAECPICKEKWAGKEASKINWRLTHLWKHGKVIHVTVSPSEKDVLNVPFEKLRQKMYRIVMGNGEDLKEYRNRHPELSAKEVDLIVNGRGIIGGSVIWHPFRENDDGTWRFSPHFHILGFGWVRNVTEGFKKDGWLVKNIQDGDKERSIFQTALYQLSHCGLSEKYRPVTWFGCCSTVGKNRPEIPEMPKETHICPCCGAELVQLDLSRAPADLPFSWSQKLDREGGWWLDPGGWVEKQQLNYRQDHSDDEDYDWE